MDNSDILILDENNWTADYTNKKYRFILLNLFTDRGPCFIDVFMLAASRLYHQGEFIVRVGSEGLHADLVEAAYLFDFELISAKNNTTNQYVFRFVGRETKLGYQMAQSSAYSDPCISLFENAFGSSISNIFWSWKYPKDKAVRSVVALKNNNAVAHYGLCDRKAIYNDITFGFSQASDVMVASDERGSISSSIFYELVQLGEKPFYAGDSSISVIYGFPHGRHYKLGARLKLYEPVSPIVNVSFDIPISNANDSKTFRGAELVEVNINTKAGIDSALQRMFAIKNVLILKRSYQYLLQRYVFHPIFKYNIYCFDGCYFVIKVTNKKIFLMDYFGEIGVYAKKLEGFISSLSNEFPNFELQLWCLNDISTLFINPKKIVDTGAVFVCKKYTSKLPDFNRWWITMGDTEFL
jgi:hypothetical protein